MSLYTIDGVFLCASIAACELLFMHAEGVENYSRKILWSQNKALAQELPALGSHLPHKETLLADAFILLFMGGLGVKERDMCFHAMGRGWGCGEYLQVKT